MSRKIGEGHAAAMGRLGLKELRNAFTPARESVADNEIGVFGTATQGEIADARGEPDHADMSQGSGLSLEDLRAYAKQLALTDGKGREPDREQSTDHGHEL
ncbi:MAG UNVERIFIED_CONTAM: hypothetical protein LVR18_20295 [Planctomycetaceae bacterium]|jgi:hypothetical protein